MVDGVFKPTCLSDQPLQDFVCLFILNQAGDAEVGVIDLYTRFDTVSHVLFGDTGGYQRGSPLCLDHLLERMRDFDFMRGSSYRLTITEDGKEHLDTIRQRWLQ